MRDKTLVEQQIRAILDTENDALALSHKLFSPDGLFNQLAKTEAERRRVAQSSLFKQPNGGFPTYSVKKPPRFPRASS